MRLSRNCPDDNPLTREWSPPGTPHTDAALDETKHWTRPLKDNVTPGMCIRWVGPEVDPRQLVDHVQYRSNYDLLTRRSVVRGIEFDSRIVS